MNRFCDVIALINKQLPGLFTYMEHSSITLHGADGINFCDVDDTTHRFETLRTAFTHLAIAANNNLEKNITSWMILGFDLNGIAKPNTQIECHDS